ncbi:MAG: aminotransferase class V-fold PLP-dependent enzyme [Bacteroidetes bacterium]|nr:aminotransferase class V-fold PLP-dependent enzyme [Bacteroidota bacterium]
MVKPNKNNEVFDLDQLSSWRSLFPIVRQVTYLNHAAVAPMSIRVKDAMDSFLQDLMTSGVDQIEASLQRREDLRIMVADLIGAPATGIAFVKNTSAALNNLAQGLTWRTGDRILMVAGEFPSNIYPFTNLKKHGVEIDILPTRNGVFSSQDLERAITTRTRLVTVSFVQFHNGFKTNLEALGTICRSKDVWLSVDSIQGCGVVPLEAKDWGIDFLANGGHKWLMSPAGIGIQYVGEELLEEMEVATLSWLSVKNAWDFDTSRIDLLDDARRFEYATENFIGIYGMHAALSLLLEVGIGNIYRHVTFLIDRLVQGLTTSGCKIISSMEPDHRSGILAFSMRSEDATRKVFDSLKSRRFIVSLRNGNIRVAPHFYNSMDEVEGFLDAVTESSGL